MPYVTSQKVKHLPSYDLTCEQDVRNDPIDLSKAAVHIRGHLSLWTFYELKGHGAYWLQQNLDDHKEFPT